MHCFGVPVFASILLSFRGVGIVHCMMRSVMFEQAGTCSERSVIGVLERGSDLLWIAGMARIGNGQYGRCGKSTCFGSSNPFSHDVAICDTHRERPVKFQ